MGMMVNERPEQIVPLFTATSGKVKTVMVETAVFCETQPRELVPVTE